MVSTTTILQMWFVGYLLSLSRDSRCWENGREEKGLDDGGKSSVFYTFRNRLGVPKYFHFNNFLTSL